MTKLFAVSRYREYIIAHPFRTVLLLAILVRLIAVVFSAGYGMHDDHFDVIEVAQSWIDGTNFFNWLSKTVEENQSGRSFFYPGLHYLLFRLLEFVNIENPASKMLVVRSLHAAISMLTVIYGYKIALKFSGEKAARWVGYGLAISWFMPFLSVRTLVETVITGPLCLAIWYLIKENYSRQNLLKFILAGVFMGFCFCTRYQSLIFTGGVWMVLCFKKKQIPVLLSVTGFIGTVGLISGYLEYVIWGHPFGKLVFYMKDNFGFLYSSVSGTVSNYNLWGGFNYILQIMGMFVPPMGVFLFIAQFKVLKKYSIVLIPSLLFLVFHILFPNRQERFVFTILPFMLITGVAGALLLVEKWKQQGRKLRGLKAIMLFSSSLNIILLMLFSVFYSKKSKIQAMEYLGKDRHLANIVIETSPFRKSIALPGFYLNKLYPKTFEYGRETNTPAFIRDYELERRVGTTYIVFLDSVKLKQRVDSLEKVFTKVSYCYTSTPDFLDEVLYKLNKVNLNQALYVYKAAGFCRDTVQQQ